MLARIQTTMRPLLVALLIGLPALCAAEDMPDPVAETRAAALMLVAAIEALAEADQATDQVMAVTGAVQAHEAALAGLRQGLSGLDRREAALAADLAARSGEVAGLVAALIGTRRIEGPALLTHPAGPLGTARAGMLLGDLAPALQADADALGAELDQLRTVRQTRDLAAQALQEGLDSLRDAHGALSAAIAAEQPPEAPIGQDEALLLALLDSAQTLETLSAGLGSLFPGRDTPEADPSSDPASDASSEPVSEPASDAAPLAERSGALPLPVAGRLVGRELAGSDGTTRPVLVLETEPDALVTTPVPALLRYSGRLEDYGNVILLEPGEGYLLLMAGLGTILPQQGTALPAGAPLGLMPAGQGMDGADASGEARAEAGVETGTDRPHRLFVELRRDGQPIDPGVWFDLSEENR